MGKTVAIDLTWVRHKQVGGTESCIRNLLDGFAEINPSEVRITLLLSEDNAESFAKYKDISCFREIVCNVKSADQKKRVLWQNTQMGKLLKKEGISICLEPVYGKPFFGMKGIKVITTIHDLQAIHYPEYFSKLRVLWMKLCWTNAVKTSHKIIAISEYVKQDILKHYHVPADRIKVIYDAIAINIEDCNDPDGLKKYGIEQGKYYYTVSSLLPHKNLETVIKAIAELKRRKSEKLFPLVISGIGGKSRDSIEQLTKENEITDKVILTPFVDDAERNMLYKNCNVFLFPSVFEGFGMPPLEAMAMGVPVLTTRCTSLEEVTCGELNYVENPYSYNEWSNRLEHELKIPGEEVSKDILIKCNYKLIAKRYIRLFV